VNGRGAKAERGYPGPTRGVYVGRRDITVIYGHDKISPSCNNNNNNRGDIYAAVIMAKRVHPVHLMNADSAPTWPPTLRPSQPTWTASPPERNGMSYYLSKIESVGLKRSVLAPDRR